MSQVSVEQGDIDSLTQSLSDIGDALSAEISALEAQVAAGAIPAGSLDGLTAVRDKLAALEPPVVTPPTP